MDGWETFSITRKGTIPVTTPRVRECGHMCSIVTGLQSLHFARVPTGALKKKNLESLELESHDFNAIKKS